MKYKIVEWLDSGASSSFDRWLSGLNEAATARALDALYRMELGNLSNAKSVGNSVFEYKIDFGPGYRIYFGRDGSELIILLCGGTKRTQQKDIKRAKEYWVQYKLRKKK